MVSKEQKQEADNLSIVGPAGWTLVVTGRYIVHMLLLMLCTGAVGYLVWDHDRFNREQTARLAVDRERQFKDVQARQEDLKEAMDTMIYVLSLSQDDRARLKLAMPPSLRARLLNEERPR